VPLGVVTDGASVREGTLPEFAWLKGDALKGECTYDSSGMTGTFEFEGKRKHARPWGGSSRGKAPCRRKSAPRWTPWWRGTCARMAATPSGASPSAPAERIGKKFGQWKLGGGPRASA
jgi:hypothetical protein